MQKALKNSSRWVVGLLCLAMCIMVGIPAAFSDPSTSGTSAEQRIATMINLAKGESAGGSGNAQVDLSKLTKDDMRILGIYLSNYYTPFVTEIGSNGDTAQTEEAHKGMVEALKTNLGVEPAIAESLIESVEGQIKGTTKKLHWMFGKNGNAKSSAELVRGNGSMATSYGQLQKNLSGRFGMLSGFSKEPLWCLSKAGSETTGYRGQELRDCWKKIYDEGSWDSTDAFKKDFKIVANDGNYWAYLVTDDGDIAFSLDLSAENVSPSVEALIAAAGMVNPVKGYGTSVFEVTQKELDEGILGTEDDKKEMNVLAHSTMLSADMGMDAFGNIVSLGSSHQYIVIPGAMNPYTWVAKDRKPGTTLMVQNAGMMGQLQNGTLFSQFADGRCTTSMAYTNAQREKMKGIWTLGGGVNGMPTTSYRIIRGASDGVKSKDILGFGGSNAGDTLLSILEDDKGYAGYDKANLFGAANVADGMSLFAWYYFGGDGTTLPEGGMNCNGNVVVFDVNQLYSGSDQNAGTGSTQILDSLGPDSTFPIMSADGKLQTKDGVVNAPSMYGNTLKAEGGEYGSLTTPDKTMDEKTSFSLYVTYLFAFYGGDSVKDTLGFTVNEDGLPDILGADQSLPVSEDVKDALAAGANDQMKDDILQWTWYLLNPAKGLNYVTTLVKNKVRAFTVDSHNDMVGTTNAPLVSGATRYVGFSGYVTVPKLTDWEPTAKLYNAYNDNYMYFLMVIVIIMGVYALTGVLSLQRAIAGILLFGLLAYTPAYLLNLTIDKSNQVSDSIYGKKFTYWALLQNQAYSSELDIAATGESYNNYLATQWAGIDSIDITGTGTGGNNKGADSIVVKWQSPKKMSSFAIGEGTLDQTLEAILANDPNYQASSNKSDGGGSGNAATDALSAAKNVAKEQEESSQVTSQLFSGMVDQFNRNISGQRFVEDDSTYLYRSYIDLGNFSRYVYGGLKDGNQSFTDSPDTSNWDPDLKEAWGKKDETYSDSVAAGYNLENSTKSVGFTDSTRVIPSLGSRIVSDTFPEADKMKDMSLKDTMGIDPRAFSAGVPSFTKGTDILADTKKNAELRFKGVDGADNEFDPSEGGKYNNEDYASLSAYALQSESPFFYFSWNLYDQGLIYTPNSSAQGEGTYKSLILGTDGGKGYFYNTEGNGEMRDFMDMRSLFTYTIPYLKQGNAVVNQYDALYGLTYNKGVPTNPGLADDPEIKSNPDLERKYWQNVNTSELYGVYSPWVDLLYDASYAEPTTIKVQGEDVRISDPLNPASYPENRPMIFSKSEQMDYGLKESDLTEVERRILATESDSAESMFGLLNSYTFNDSVLNTGAAMQTTFAFNKNFSTQSLIGNNVTMYPQNFELNNFSYDAYLRLILSNSTGDSLTDKSTNSGSAFYTQVVQNSGLFTGVTMLTLDVLSVYVLPAAKVLLVLMVWVLSVLKVLSLALKIEEGKKLANSVLHGVILPFLGIFLVFTGMAWVVSWFMSNGNTSVTGYDGVSVSLGDPVMVMLIMILINLTVIFLLWKLFMMIFRQLRSTTGDITASMGGVALGAVSMVKGIGSGQGFSAMRSSAAKAAGSASGGRIGGNAGGADDMHARQQAMGDPAPSARDRSNKHGTVLLGDRAERERRSRERENRRSNRAGVGGAGEKKGLLRRRKPGTDGSGDGQGGAGSAEGTGKRDSLRDRLNSGSRGSGGGGSTSGNGSRGDLRNPTDSATGSRSDRTSGGGFPRNPLNGRNRKGDQE